MTQLFNEYCPNGKYSLEKVIFKLFHFHINNYS